MGLNHAAIRAAYPNAVLIDDGEGAFDASGNQIVLDNAKVDAEATKLQTTWDNNKYQRDREAEYPPVVDQLDDIYHNGVDGWKATIKATKDKYPKP